MGFIKCYRPAKPPQDQFYRPLLMSIELSRAKKASGCGRKIISYKAPCPQCGCGCKLPDGRPAGMAYSNNLCCPGNKTGACRPGRKCSLGPRLLGQGPCDPPCFSKFVFPEYAPFVPEPKYQPPTMSLCLDGCGLAPCGGTSMYGAFTRSGFSCNTCQGCGNSCGVNDVSARPIHGTNNAGCGCGRCHNVDACVVSANGPGCTGSSCADQISQGDGPVRGQGMGAGNANANFNDDSGCNGGVNDLY